MTYLGHTVAKTLIRCHFSPLATTGGAYLLTGSFEGTAYIYDALTGDVVHHPIQVDRPDWYSRFCEQPSQAVASRIKLLEALADSSALLIPAHFPTPTRVRIGRTPQGFRTVTD